MRITKAFVERSIKWLHLFDSENPVGLICQIRLSWFGPQKDGHKIIPHRHFSKLPSLMSFSLSDRNTDTLASFFLTLL